MAHLMQSRKSASGSELMNQKRKKEPKNGSDTNR